MKYEKGGGNGNDSEVLSQDSENYNEEYMQMVQDGTL